MTTLKTNLIELENIKLLAFDLDKTLYPESSGLADQIYDLIIKEAKRQGVDFDENDLMSTLFLQDDLGRDLMTRLSDAGKFDMKALEKGFVDAIDRSVLVPCTQTIALLEALPMKSIVCTDSPSIHAELTLAELKKDHIFAEICSCSSRNRNFKPYLPIYENICTRHNVAPSEVIFVEDSPINLEPAHAMGMKTVLVGSQVKNDYSYVDYAYEDVLDFLKDCQYKGRLLSELAKK